MRRSVNPDFDFEKEKYAEVLRRAIGDRSISMFSKDVGISAGYVSRYLNLKCDVTPTIATIKKIAKATKMVSYTELLEAAGYDSEKYLEFEADDRELFGEDKPSGFMSYFASVFSAVTRADFNWKFSSVANNGKEPFSVQIEGAPFDVWYFIPVNKADIKKEDIVTALSGTELAISPGSKVSFMTSSKVIYSALKEMNFGLLSLYISVLYVDSVSGSVKEEIYLKTVIEVSNQDKKRFSIVNVAGDDCVPFYSL